MEGPITPYEAQRMCEWRLQDVPVKEIARRLGRSEYPVRKYTKGIRPPQGTRNHPPKLKAEILLLYGKGLSNSEIGAMLGLTRAAVGRSLRRRGVRRNRTGDRQDISSHAA